MLTLQVKRLREEARVPTKAHKLDAGWDLYAAEPHYLHPEGHTGVILTGVALQIPEGWCAVVQDRSSLAALGFAVTGVILPDGLGLTVTGRVIDSWFRGEVKVVLTNHGPCARPINAGDRIAQFTLHEVPEAEIVEAGELEPSPRGAAGFGSTGV